jgi:hypothetical protein
VPREEHFVDELMKRSGVGNKIPRGQKGPIKVHMATL